MRSSLIVRMMVTAVPITARATPVSKIRAVANSVSPKNGMSKYPKVWVKKGTSTKKTSHTGQYGN